MSLSDEERRRIEREELTRAEARIRAEALVRKKLQEEQQDAKAGTGSGGEGTSRTESDSVAERKRIDGALACPHCHQLDKVQKVTAVVDAGTSRTDLAGPALGGAYTFGGEGRLSLEAAYTTLSGSQQTTIGRRLLAPPEPPDPQFQDTSGRAFGFLLCIICLIGFLAAVFMVGLLEAIGIPSIVTLVLVGILLVVLILSWSTVREAARESVRESDEAAFNFQKEKKSRWKGAMAKWQQLYYCHRCDGVFLPGSASIAPSSQMQDYLLRTGE
jgi:hypothetical protein